MEERKIKVGITGQSGFIGTHLFNFLMLQKDFTLVEFKRDFFNDERLLDQFVSHCDVIIHLAALNRNNDPTIIYKTNIELTEKLVSSLKRTKSNAHVIHSSSTQENKENLYGLSKKESRELLVNWSKVSDGKFTGLIIPNVFGPFGRPFYNSFISTFSYQLINNEEPKIIVDAEIKLIYVQDLVNFIIKIIREKIYSDYLLVPFNLKIKVSDVLKKLKNYYSRYFLNSIFPSLNEYFDIALFNTFRSYLPLDFFPKFLNLHKDERGSFVEVVKSLSSGQFSYSITKPGITRGNHYHIRKIERFIVIQGKAEIKLRKIGSKDVYTYTLDGNNPSFVDIPVWYTHNITNVGKEDLVTLFWINEFYNPNDSDTYYEEV